MQTQLACEVKNLINKKCSQQLLIQLLNTKWQNGNLTILKKKFSNKGTKGIQDISLSLQTS